MDWLEKMEWELDEGIKEVRLIFRYISVLIILGVCVILILGTAGQTAQYLFDHNTGIISMQTIILPFKFTFFALIIKLTLEWLVSPL